MEPSGQSGFWYCSNTECESHLLPVTNDFLYGDGIIFAEGQVGIVTGLNCSECGRGMESLKIDWDDRERIDPIPFYSKYTLGEQELRRYRRLYI